MKAMKKAILLTVCIMMGAISQLMAQPMNRAGLNAPGVQYLITEYGDELELTGEQKSELIALQIEHRNQFRPDDRPARRGDRGNFRRDRGNRNFDRDFRADRFEARMEMRQEVLDILTDEQENLLETKMIEKAEKANEFRTFRHQYFVEEAGIEGDKAEQVLSLLNTQSADRLELAKQRIQNPTEVDQELWTRHFEKMRETDDQLQSILTVNEYQKLRQNMGFGRRGPGNGNRGLRRWSR